MRPPIELNEFMAPKADRVRAASAEAAAAAVGYVAAFPPIVFAGIQDKATATGFMGSSTRAPRMQLGFGLFWLNCLHCRHASPSLRKPVVEGGYGDFDLER